MGSVRCISRRCPQTGNRPFRCTLNILGQLLTSRVFYYSFYFNDRTLQSRESEREDVSASFSTSIVLEGQRLGRFYICIRAKQRNIMIGMMSQDMNHAEQDILCEHIER